LLSKQELSTILTQVKTDFLGINGGTKLKLDFEGFE